MIEVDGEVHPDSAVLRTCYALAELASFETSKAGTLLLVRVTPIPPAAIDLVLERFRTSLVDFTIREQVEARTKGLRDLIWQTAFAEANGQGSS
ncbi:His-Xaa-Ser system protein HxsD [Bradyrhizobium elkanii]|uniref:His-Xaa-Ser system protein HxsD n=1 Tax=Bradyrhizobium TaxID=374 RepID=UPI0021688F2A|nr:MULTISPECIES: His-Xaa-Ser system protein HxsD [Bradyrhizobium]MCS3929000.1 His-Xaa-Ser system protein HxsD [Bradyrhizobium elkanii]MCS3969556.1 His-Xaa-Ser system protein HxsD [Bradyrhizobium japonicum]